MDIVRRSPAGLVIKIIAIEISLEIIYLLLSTALVEVRSQAGESYTLACYFICYVLKSCDNCCRHLSRSVGK